MNYIYDIVLNFNRDYFEFFQWKKGDKIINVKKIPAFKVSSEDLKYLKYNIVKVSKEFLDKIYNLTCFYSKMDYKYLCLVSDTNESLGIMFDKDGKLIKRSSLVFDEEDEVNEEVCGDDFVKIEYVENRNKNIEYLSRIEKERRDFLLKFVNNLDVNDDENILKYIYYDYFEKEEEDTLKIKQIIINKINDINCDKMRLYNLVKVFRKIKN